MTQSRHLTVTEAALLAGVNVKTIRRAITPSKVAGFRLLPSHRAGGDIRILIREDDLRAWIAGGLP